MVSALEWAEIRTLARDGVSRREIARRLGINRRTVVRALESDAPPRYVRPPAVSQLDPLMPVIREVLEVMAGDQSAEVDGAFARRAWV